MPVKRISIEDYVSYNPVTVGPKTTVDEVIGLFREHKFRHLPVLESGKAVGIISDRDVLIARPMGAMEALRARDVMTHSPYGVSVDTALEEVALELSKRKFSSAIVYDRKNNFCGIFTATDALNALVEVLREKR